MQLKHVGLGWWDCTVHEVRDTGIWGSHYRCRQSLEVSNPCIFVSGIILIKYVSLLLRIFFFFYFCSSVCAYVCVCVNYATHTCKYRMKMCWCSCRVGRCSSQRLEMTSKYYSWFIFLIVVFLFCFILGDFCLVFCSLDTELVRLRGTSGGPMVHVLLRWGHLEPVAQDCVSHSFWVSLRRGILHTPWATCARASSLSQVKICILIFLCFN